MISCERASSLFGPAWDDELSVAEREALESHFATCPACQRGYDEYARTLELVQGLPRPQVADDFATRVLNEARARELAASQRTARPWNLVAFRPQYAAAAALLVLAATGTIVFTRPHAGAPVVAPSRGDRAPVAALVPRVPAPGAATRVAGDPDGPVTALKSSVRPAPTALAQATPLRRVRAPRPTAGNAMASLVPDSLFDHSQDVDFVNDPVKLRRERGRGYTPVTGSVQGQAASITF